MVVFVVAVGRVRDTDLRAACDDYLARARRTQRVEVREVADAGRAGADPAGARRIEAERLATALPTGAVAVALTRTGDALSSRQLAERVGRWRDAARDVAFLVGGAFGLDAALVDRCHARLSLSSLTLPHELARLVLLEQLYRAGTILRGEPYHKATDA